MRLRWKVLLLAALFPPLALLLGVVLTLQTEPLVADRLAVSSGDIARAVAMARANDPRRHRPGLPRQVSLTQRDLELMLNHGARRWISAPAVRVTLSPFHGRLQASVRLPGVPVALWLNLDARVREGQNLPELDSLHVGQLPVPSWAATWAVRRAGLRVGLDIDPQIVRDVVQHVSLTHGVATVSYTWQADTHLRLMASLVPPSEQARLKAYSDHLVQLAGLEGSTGEDVLLTDLLPSMFSLARQRAADGGDAAAENRAALLVLAMHATGRGLSTLVPAASAWPRARGLRMTLHGRDDFPQHFLVSAVLAAEGSGALSDAIGLYKEVMDARHGSGFSFNDIAADRAGTRFGELAVRDPQRMQAALLGRLTEHALMPDVSDLPEFLGEAEFLKRFGGVGGAPYRQVLTDIDARIGATPLLR